MYVILTREIGMTPGQATGKGHGAALVAEGPAEWKAGRAASILFQRSGPLLRRVTAGARPDRGGRIRRATAMAQLRAGSDGHDSGGSQCDRRK